MQKIVQTRSFLSYTIKYTSTIMRNPSLHNSGKGVRHGCASILDSIAKGTSCFHYFRMVHPYIAIHSIPLNDFYTCINGVLIRECVD